ncbi:MAG: hypothetical protein OXI55_15185 [Gammaproteobacteria bacterium]|nr:hypothetical protein [Gammaproteobacteria bacterium]
MAAVRTIGALLEAQGATWALAGALAANVYRHDVRATGDVDLLVGFGAFDSASALAALADSLERTGWALTDRRNQDWMLRARHPEYGLVDVLSVGMVYQERAVERAVVHVGDDGTQLRVLAIEDVLIHKLIADRSKDAADVESILATDPEMDLAYLNHWLAEWAIEDRYERTKDVVRARQAAACERNQ